MRIYINELIKVFFMKSTIVIFFALTFLNGILLRVNEGQNDLLYTPTQYKAVFEDLEGLSAEEAYKQLSVYYEKTVIFQQLLFGTDISCISTENQSIDIEQVLFEFENKSGVKYSTNYITEQYLLKDILSEIESCMRYEDYLSGIDETVARMTSMSIFAQPGSFTYKNYLKTAEDFSHLKGSVLDAAPSKGISMATDFLCTDIIAFLMILTVSVSIVTREKETNQLTILRTAYKGRLSLAATKLFVCFTAAVISALMLYTVNFAVSAYTYGLGNLQRQLQSVFDFYDSNLKISVIQYIILFLASKIAVYCVFAAIIYFVTVMSDNAAKTYCILFITIAVEALLYYSIEGTSYLYLLKYINIISFANTYTLFSDYLNLNFFGQPVNYVTVFTVTVTVLLVALSATSVLLFQKQKLYNISKKSFLFAGLTFSRGSHTSLFLHECYKVFISGKVLFILIAFSVLTFITYTPMEETFSSADEFFYKSYMLTLEGVYNEQKQQIIDNEESKFSDAAIQMQQELAECSDDTQTAFIIMKYQPVFARQNSFELVKLHTEYIRSTQNGEFIYDAGYKLLTGDKSAGSKDLTLGLTAISMLICCLVYVYSVEYHTEMCTLLKCSANGRAKTFVCKLIIGIFIVTVIYILTYAPYFYNVLSTYGTQGINAPAYSIEALSGFNMSIKSYLYTICIIRYIALISAMLIIFFLSIRIKSIIYTFLASVTLLIFPLILSLLGVKFFDYVLLNPVIIAHIY